MLRKTITAFVLLILLGSVFSPISTVAAQASDPAYLSFGPA